MPDLGELGDWFDGVELSSPAPGVVVMNHAPSRCAGRACCVHNPSDHHMRDWPMTFRSDRARYVGDRVFVLTERICPHGVGHPDPDSMDYLRSIGSSDEVAGEGIHGCDRCCKPHGE